MSVDVRSCFPVAPDTLCLFMHGPHRKDSDMEVPLRPIDTIKPYPQNPRRNDTAWTPSPSPLRSSAGATPPWWMSRASSSAGIRAEGRGEARHHGTKCLTPEQAVRPASVGAAWGKVGNGGGDGAEWGPDGVTGGRAPPAH